VALSDEQQAMLRLLAQGEQGYADIAALMALTEDDVRAKVIGALAQLQAEGKPAPDIPPPLAGGAHPAAEAAPPEPEPAPPAASEEPDEPAIAESVAPKPAPGEPAEQNPSSTEPGAGAAESRPAKPAPESIAQPAATPPTSPPPSGRTPSGGRTITLPSGRNAWLWGGGVIAAVVVIVVVILLAAGGGGGSSTTATEAGSTTAEEGKGETTSSGKESTQAELKAVDGSEAEGRATFGRVKNKLALQIEAKGLEPTVEGTNSYAVFLAQSPQRMLPLASIGVKGSGKGAHEIAAQFEVPVEILAYLAKGTFDQIAITKVDDKRFEAAVNVATKKKSAPTYTGEEVLRGTITGPIIGLAAREEEAKKAEEGE
jgi:hypothetical protein